jgi:hypothetical protein
MAAGRVNVGEQGASRAAAMELQARTRLPRGCRMKHVLAVLVIAASFAVAASGRAQVQQGAPPSAPPANAPGSAAPPDTLRPAVPPAQPARRAANKPASRSSDRVANDLNRQELNRISSGNRPVYGPPVAAAPAYAPPPPWYPPPSPYPWPYRPMPYPPPMWYPPPPW